jgi:hypothetical protein
MRMLCLLLFYSRRAELQTTVSHSWTGHVLLVFQQNLVGGAALVGGAPTTGVGMLLFALTLLLVAGAATQP